jgi:hypothetical protein
MGKKRGGSEEGKRKDYDGKNESRLGHSKLNISVCATSGEKDEVKRRIIRCAWEIAARYGGK